jgi:hypothetical protein
VSVQPETAMTEPVPTPSRIEWAWQRGSEIVALVFGSAGGQTPDAFRGETEERIWTSNARRVRPRHAPTRLRVRFKLP